MEGDTLTIPVLEVFGPTLQGEGQVIGRKTVFVRTAGCDSRCAWCDSAFTWDGSAKDQIRHMGVGALVAEIEKVGGMSFDHVTISGGNPALIGAPMQALIMTLKLHGYAVAIETQGTRWQDWFTLVTDLTLSPKPPSAIHGGFKESMFQMIIKRLQEANYTGHVIKIVVFDEADYEWARMVHLAYPSVPFYLQVGNADVTTLSVPKDGSFDAQIEAEQLHLEFVKGLLDKLQWLADKVIADPMMNDVRVLPQLHTLLWGNKRGV